MGKPGMRWLAHSLERKLVFGVGIGLVAFTLVAGFVTAGLAKHYQAESSLNLQTQLVATVQAQAEVAVFARNDEIAQGVIHGLLANPLLLAVRIESPQGFSSQGGPASAFHQPATLTSYPLYSPVEHHQQIGQIHVVMNADEVTAQIVTTTRNLLWVVALQVILASVLIVAFSRRLILMPIADLTRKMTELEPGNGNYLDFDPEHAEDEIGQLSHSANTFIAAHERALAELRELAITDTLTGISNRRHFLARLEDELARLKRHESLRSTVLMLDIDHFKKINDTWGHGAGDAALRQLGAILRHNIRKIDAVGRLGGEEFAILIADDGPEEGQRFAERLRQVVADSAILHDDTEIRMTLSIGISTMQPGDRYTSEVLARADAALYAAKQGGRNRVILHDQTAPPPPHGGPSPDPS